jgi:hypothetical protein
MLLLVAWHGVLSQAGGWLPCEDVALVLQHILIHTIPQVSSFFSVCGLGSGVVKQTPRARTHQGFSVMRSTLLHRK